MHVHNVPTLLFVVKKNQGVYLCPLKLFQGVPSHDPLKIFQGVHIQDILCTLGYIRTMRSGGRGTFAYGAFVPALLSCESEIHLNSTRDR